MTLALVLLFQNATPLPDVPKNHWIYVGAALTKRSGLMEGYFDTRELSHHPPALTPMELAERIAVAIDNLERVEVGLTDERDLLVALPRDSKWAESAKQFFEWRKTYGDLRLDAFFARSLRTYPQAFEAQGRSPGNLRERANFAFRYIRSLSPPKG